MSPPDPPAKPRNPAKPRSARPASPPGAAPRPRRASAASASAAPGGPEAERPQAPPFSLPSDDGAVVSLDGLRGKRVVLYFYPKDDTPGCTREACAFQAALEGLRGQGAEVIGVSRDGAAAHRRFRQKYGLTFPLLSDPDAAIHRAYGAWGIKTLYGRQSEGCIRTTVLIDAEGRVARRWSPVKVDGHAEQVSEALAQTS